MEVNAKDIMIDTPAIRELVPFVRTPENLDYTFLLGYHFQPDDFPLSLRRLYQEADAVLHERIAWTDVEVAGLNEVARGDVNPIDPKFSKHPLTQRQLTLVHRTNAGQGMWDIPSSHTAATKYLGYFSTHTQRTDTASLQEFYNAVVGRDRMAVRTIGLRAVNAFRMSRGIISPRKVLITAGISHIALANAIRLHVTESGLGTARIQLNKPTLTLDSESRFVLEKLRAGQDTQGE